MTIDPKAYPTLTGLRVALVHDLLTQQGGAERILDVLHSLWPQAPIYTLIYNRQVFGDRYADATIRPSFIQRLPWSITKFKWYLALMPRAVEALDFSGFDLVISDASAFAKGVKVPANVPHLCYLHSPTRYLWSDRESYLKTAPVPVWARPFLNLLMPQLQAWDLVAAQRPNRMIVNSQTVADRTKRYYHRTADALIFPPVDTTTFSIRPSIKEYWFTSGRMEPYKRLDLILDAFAELGWPLKVAGAGSRSSDYDRWSQFSNIEFVGRVSDTELATLYGEAKAFVFAAEEDAGIVPLEAMASGRPVLAYGKGGAVESVVPGITGEYFAKQTVQSLVAALKAFRPESYDPTAIRAHAMTFDTAVFVEKFLAQVAKTIDQKHQA